MLLFVLIGFFSGMTASMGLGGGSILILFLTMVLNYEQKTAQGVNLLFFIPIALFSTIVYIKNGIIEWKKIIPTIITGMISSFISANILVKMSSSLLRKTFGAFILIIGIKTLFSLTKSRKISSPLS
ncbi:MAG: sulfite exporter TauE/SafE family protein [Ruminococcus sp.]|nr:sulfite exporter TauE/SafE family protein [Ruminococcus sp.]